MTRGLQNSNPGNIRKGQPWKGLAEDQLDPIFCTFVSPEFGIRAIMVILSNYAKEGVDTVTAIISRWAPPNENNTQAYISAVASQMGVDAGTVVPIAQGLYTDLCKAIIKHENGLQPYPDEVFAKAWQLAALTSA